MTLSSPIVPRTAEELEREVLSLYRYPLRKRATRKMMVQTFRELRALSAFQLTTDLTPGLVSDWICAHPGRSSVRTEALLRNVRVIANLAKAMRWLDVSPFEVRRLKAWLRPDAVPSRNLDRVYRRSQDEIQRLLRLLDNEASASWQGRRLQCLVYVYVYTAFRKQEALHLLASNVNFERQTITIKPLAPDWTPKTVVSARTAPMPSVLAEVLRPWVRICGSELCQEQCGYGYLFPGTKLVGPWAAGSPPYDAYSQIIAAGERAAIGHITPIYARHWFGTNAKTMGLGKLEVQGYLGHACPYTQRYYDDEAVESLRPAANRLELFYGSASAAQ